MMLKHWSKIVASVLVVSSGLTSCSLLGKGSIPQIQAICDSMRSRVVQIGSLVPDTEAYSDSEGLAILSGSADRQALLKKILGLMPYLSNYQLADYKSGAYQTGMGDWRIREMSLLFAKSPVTLDFTAAERTKISAKGRDAYEAVVLPRIEFYLGPDYRPEGASQADGCQELDLAADVAFENSVESQWDFYQNQLNEYADNYFWILSCKKSGKVDGAKCADTKYESKPTNSSEICSERLKTTTNAAEPGITCGKLRFEVFQSDKNTGGCTALAWWNDKNGIRQVGAFYTCGLEEGLTYDEKVTVGNPTTYTNNFGVEKTVISFSLNGF